MSTDVAKGNVAVKKYTEVLVKNEPNKIIKRTIDIIGAIVGILFLIPLTVGIAIAKIILKDNK